MPPAVSDTDSDSGSGSIEDGAVLVVSDVTKGKEKVVLPNETKIMGNGREQRPKAKAKATLEEDLGHEDEDEDEDEAGSDNEGGEEEVYVVEKVVNHDAVGNTIVYNVKWHGYDNSENTWEPEENLEGARDILQIYFDKIGGRPTDGTKPNAKKRGRKSMSETASPNPVTKKPKGEIPMRHNRNRKEHLDSGNGSQNENRWQTTRADSDWQPPKPRKDAWEDMVLKVEALEADEKDGTKWAFLLWALEDEDGKKRTSKALLTSVSVAAPQALIKYYEQHLVFTNPPARPDPPKNVGHAPLKNQISD